MALSTLIVPVLLTFTACFALGKRVDVYSALTKGAEEGLTVLLHILPSLIALLSAVYMFRASGAMEALGALLAPALDKIGIPAETAPLLFIRPISGSGALAVGSEIMDSYGVDSYVGRVAAVMLGSSETTFYTVAVYFGAAEQEYSWAQPIPEGVFDSYDVQLVAPLDENDPVPSCRNADGPYHDGQYVLTVDGFLVTPNVAVDSAAVLDTDFSYSDHNPVQMTFTLQK